MKVLHRGILEGRARRGSLLLAAILGGAGVLGSGCRLGSFADIKPAGTTGSSGSTGPSGSSGGVSVVFTPVENLSGSHDSQAQASFLPRNVFVDGAGNLFLAYEEVDAAGERQVRFVKQLVGASFTTPVPVSEATALTGFVLEGSTRMAVDPAGVVTIVWQQGEVSPAAQIFFATDRGGAFATPENLSPDASASSTPDVVVDLDGDAHVVFNHAGAVAEVVHVGVFAGVPGSAVVISSDAIAGRFLPGGLSVDSGTATETQGLDAVWLETPSGENTRAVHRNRTAGSGGSFGSVTDISVLPAGGHGDPGEFDTGPIVRHDPSGNLHVIFVHATTNARNVLRNVRPVSGSFLSRAHDVTGSSIEDCSLFDLDVDGSGNLFVFWEARPGTGDATLRFKAFAAGEDPAGLPVLEIDVADRVLEHRLQVVLDGLGVAHLAWEFEDATGQRDVRSRRRSAGDVLSSIEAVLASSVDERLAGLAVTVAGRAFTLVEQGPASSADRDILISVREAAGGSILVNLSASAGRDSLAGALVLDPFDEAQVFWLESFSGLEDLFFTAGR